MKQETAARRLLPVLSLALILAAASSVQASGFMPAPRNGPADGQLYLTPGLALYKAPGGNKSHVGPALGIGYMGSGGLGLEFLYSHMDVEYDAPDAQGGDIEGNADLYWANLVYKVGRGSGWQPFLLAGAGLSDLPGDTKAELNVGAGVFGSFGARWFLRSDVRAVRGVGSGDDIEPFFTLGLSVALGDLPIPADTPSTGRRPAAPATRQDTGAVGKVRRETNQEAISETEAEQQSAVDDGDAPLREVVIEIRFDFDSDRIRAEDHLDVQRIANFLRDNPGAKAVLEGHADSRGAEAYNQRLSERRANSVLRRLVDVEGIDPGRLVAIGHGELRPIVPNDTDANRQINRRVESKSDGKRIVVLLR